MHVKLYSIASGLAFGESQKLLITFVVSFSTSRCTAGWKTRHALQHAESGYIHASQHIISTAMHSVHVSPQQLRHGALQHSAAAAAFGLPSAQQQRRGDMQAASPRPWSTAGSCVPTGAASAADAAEPATAAEVRGARETANSSQETARVAQALVLQALLLQ